MEINCEFVTMESDVYMCDISEAEITEKNHQIKAFKGDHEKGKTHNDVTSVWIQETIVDFFPRGLEKHFPNINCLMVTGCSLKEISKYDLQGLQGLVELSVQNCQLTSLPDDLLSDMPNLRKVILYNNQIKFASSELLKPLQGRQDVKVDLRKNKSINARFWPDEKGSLNSLEDLMKLIDEQCIKPADPVDFNPKLKELWQSGRFSDVNIIAGDQKFKAHKNVLGMQSSVFAQIFEDQVDATEIKIPDFSSKSVEALLKFIYTAEITNDEHAKENFKIAGKFKVAAMKTKYEEIIFSQVNDLNAWEMFVYAHDIASQELKKKAFNRIASKLRDDLPAEFMDDPVKLKKLLDARQVYDEILENK